jgi:gliding motility-associated-like protein
MKLISKFILIILFACYSSAMVQAQTCPSVNAAAGTGASTTICSGSCVNLTASVVPVNSTSSYSVSATSYSPFPFSGGTNATGGVDDVWSPAVNIGFNFCYFGNTFNQLIIGSNGEISFDLSFAAGRENFLINSVLPNLADHPGNTICAAFRDIDPSSGATSNIAYYTTGTAPCRKFVAYWTNVPLFQCNTPESSFQVVLHETTNIIEVYVQNSTSCGLWQSGKGLMGIQNAGGTTVVAPPGRNVLTPWSATNEAWRYTPSGANTYTVNWSGPSGFSATGLTAAVCPTTTSTYTASMNISNCSGGITTFTSAVQVSVTPVPVLTVAATPTAICRGSSSVLSVSGASSYTWSPGGSNSSSITVTPTVTTTYTVRGTSNGCVTTRTISLLVNANPTINAARNPSVICSAGGTSTLTATGGTSYTWNPGGLIGTPIVVSPTATTIYTVTGRSAAGCIGTRTTNVLVSASPTVIASSSQSTICATSPVSLTASGASTYTWTPGNITGGTVVTTPTASTTYTVIGRNTAGCSSTNSLFINVTPGLTITPVASPTIICRGQSSTLTVTGANNYTWMPGALTGTNVVVSPTVSTTYTVTGSDVSCVGTNTIRVAVSVPTVNATRTPTAICIGGTSTLTASGASTYTWQPINISVNPVAVSPTVTSIFTVTGTNTLGCTASGTVQVNVNALPNVTATGNPTLTCIGNTSTLSASGASTYTWIPGNITTATAIVSPTINTTYTVTGRATTGCVRTRTVDIQVAPALTLTPISSSSLICRGSSSTLTVTGANTYTWSPGAITGSVAVVSPSATINYTVFGRNLSGCSSTGSIQIIVSTASVTATSNPADLCSSSSATLSASGANTYTWEPGTISGSTVSVSPASTTIYTVNATNIDGCSATSTLNLIVGTAPTLSLSASSTTVCSASSVTLTASGANSYTWNPGTITNSVTVVNPTSTTVYSVIGQNASGCSITNTIEINVSPNLTVTAVSNPTILCSGNVATLTATGADSYTWNPGNMIGSTHTVNPITSKVYTISATNTLGCVGSATLDLKASPTPTVLVSSNTPTVCLGSSAILTANGGFTYTWSPGSITGASVSVSPSVTTVYTVSGNNGLGCISTNTISIDVVPISVLSTTVSNNPICPGFTINIQASGANTYTWNPGNLTGNSVTVSPTAQTIYTVSATNTLGCISSETVQINMSPAPILTVSASSNSICSGSSSTLSVTGALSYTWLPSGSNSSSISVTPSVTTTYTITGDNGLACFGVDVITVFVESSLTVSVNAIPSATICSGTNLVIEASGANSYTWNPGVINSYSINASPTSTQIFTVDGQSTLGCASQNTIEIVVLNTPTISASSDFTVVCSSANTVSLSASGALSYTWMPGNINSNSTIQNPTITTTYSVTGSDGICSSTQTITVNVNQNPVITSVTSSSGISCLTPSISLNASSTDPDVSYSWSGPNSYTSGVSNPNDISVAGDYTLSVTNTISACSTSTIISVIGNTNVPDLSFSSSGDLGCSTSVILNASSTSTNPLTYLWSGPSSFTTNNQSLIINNAGDYTITVIDNLNGCIASGTLTVNTNTLLPAISSTIIPSTCTGTLVNNDGTILINGFSLLDKYDLVQASTYTGTANYSTAFTIPVNGVITNTLANPSTPIDYTIRFFGTNGCFKDTTLTLIVNDCAPSNVVGLTKSVSVPTLTSNSIYNITYTIVAVNPTNFDLIDFNIRDNLSNTFPSPVSFTVVGQPTVSSIGSSLVPNNAYDGITQLDLLNPTTSTLSANRSDTIIFSIAINPNGLFTTFFNSAFCYGFDSFNQLVADSSNTGFVWDPDGDGNPANNNIPTPLNLIPNASLGIAKSGTISELLPDKTFDITYVITAVNLGNDTIRDLQITDSIQIPQPAVYYIKSGPNTSLGLTPNLTYNGANNILLLSGLDKLAPNATKTISIIVNIKPDTVTTVVNSAIGFGNASLGSTVRDTSNNGAVADVDGNGYAGDSNESLPTIIKIPDIELFVPEVITPNGDGKNDFFIIKGTQGKSVNLIVFNRWGNKVYENNQYDNTWDGTPNAGGIIGDGKLPQGTYYYIVEFSDGETKSLNGFVVIQY